MNNHFQLLIIEFGKLWYFKSISNTILTNGLVYKVLTQVYYILFI